MHLVIPAHVCIFWVVCHSSTIFPLKELKWEPQNRIPLLPTTKPHPLLPLTYGSPSLYWLSTSRWCLSLVRAPLPMPVHCFSSIHAFAVACRFVWFCYVFCCLFDSLLRGWVIGSSFFAFRFFFRLGITWVWAFSFLIQPLSPFTSGSWASWYSCHATTLFLPWYHLTLFAGLPLVLPCQFHVLFLSLVHVAQYSY